MNRVRILLCAAVVVVACGVDQPTSSPTAPLEVSPPPGAGNWQLADEVTWEDTLRFSLWISDDTVSPGEALDVRTEVENLTDQEVPYTIVSKAGPPITTTLASPIGIAIFPQLTSDAELGAQPGKVGTLEPNETLQQEASWDGTIPVSGESLPAPNGRYDLSASFAPGEPPVEQENQLELSAAIEVTGSDNVILSQAEAQDRATQLPEVEEWADEHRGDAVAKREGDQYLVLMGDEWAPASRETYEQARTQPLGADVHLTLRGWEVVLGMAPFGPPPHQGLVVLDHETGEVLSLEWFFPQGATPEPTGELPPQ